MCFRQCPMVCTLFDSGSGKGCRKAAGSVVLPTSHACERGQHVAERDGANEPIAWQGESASRKSLKEYGARLYYSVITNGLRLPRMLCSPCTAGNYGWTTDSRSMRSKCNYFRRPLTLLVAGCCVSASYLSCTVGTAIRSGSSRSSQPTDRLRRTFCKPHQLRSKYPLSQPHLNAKLHQALTSREHSFDAICVGRPLKLVTELNRGCSMPIRSH